jgi:multiple sugar transport system substrate-binding protein
LPQDKAVEQLDQQVDDILAKRRWIVEQQADAAAKAAP